MVGRVLKRGVIGLALVTAGLWLGNTSAFVDVSDHQMRIIAHRGVHHVYAGEARDADTCRARSVAPITHDLIENTLPSMVAAFAAGADVVEIDVHLTRDKRFAVFHDWRLECQTNGQGETRAQDLASLQALDVAHNLSDDGGVSFPLRGRGEGMMPSLAQVLSADLAGPVLVNFKSNDPDEGAHFADVLQSHDPTRVWAVYGGARPTRAAQQATGLRGFDRDALKACGLRYVALGWSGYVPKACRNRVIAVPMTFAPYLWGWPHRFTKRMAAHGTDVILWGPYDGSGFSSGIDSADVLAQVPRGFDGYLWTNRVEVIGPLLRGERQP